MKLRIKGNNIRLRLTQSEVHALAEKGIVEESTVLSPFDIFTYNVQTWNLSVTEVKWKNTTLSIFVASENAKHFSLSNEENISAVFDNGTSTPLNILIEKDYACLKEREGEDESDNFPHPAQGAQKC